MKISKKFLLFSSLTVIILAVIGLGYAVVSYANSAWNNKDTWTTEQVLIVQPQAKDLKVTINGDISSGDFSFMADYCQLYEVETTDDTATLKCSLLPYYYTTRALEAPKDWDESMDIKLLVKKSDPAPKQYLGRIDRSFDSVQSFGSEPVAVSFYVEGKSIKPERTFIRNFEHALAAYKGKKESVEVVVTSFEVLPLADKTAAEYSAYAKQWATSLNDEVVARLEQSSISAKSGQEYLNVFRNDLSFGRIECSKLNTCRYAYEASPAENFMYYLYSREYLNNAEFSKITTAATAQLYPFSAQRVSESGDQLCSTCTPDWTELSAYTFPICPINDVVTGKKSKGTEYFNTYITKFLAKRLTLPTTDAKALALLDIYKKGDFVANNNWDRDIIDNINLACHYVLTNDANVATSTKERLVSTYFSMLSEYVGNTISSDRASIEKYIYQSTVFSPYKTAYIADSSIHKFREQSLESSKIAAADYIEWRSVLHSLVLLYVYAGLTQN